MKNFLTVMAGVVLFSLCSRNTDKLRDVAPLLLSTPSETVENTGLNTYPNDSNPGGPSNTNPGPGTRPMAADVLGVMRPVAGYLDDGTPYFAKILSGSFGASDYWVMMPHQIPSAHSMSRIIAVSVNVKSASSTTQVSSSATAVYPTTSDFSNNDVQVMRGVNGVACSVYVTLLYK